MGRELPFRPFTPETLAQRWGCSSKHVRNMVKRGELQAFRLGGKLLRISAEEVGRYECQAIDLPDTGENTLSSGTATMGADIAARLARMTPPPRKPVLLNLEAMPRGSAGRKGRTSE